MNENEIQVWNYESSEIRTIQKDGEPWFVLADVCKVLEIARGTKVAERLEEDEVRQTSITDSLGRQQKAKIPTLEQVQAYANEQQAVTSPERFYNYFAANGWVDSKNRPIQDWKATFRYWDIQDREKANSKQKPALSPEKAAIYEELTYTPSPLSLQKNKDVSA